MNWLLLTTGDLPEAYVMARYLLGQAQEVTLFNIQGRTPAQQRRVLLRLARRRGWLYMADLILGRRFRSRYLRPGVPIFPDITREAMAEVQSRCAYSLISDPHDDDTRHRVSTLQPDYILFLGAPVIKPALFTLARRGALNWHHGLSPRYRGSDCVIWAMANNEFDQIGFTIHRVSEVVDGGGILLQRPVAARTDLDFTESIADIARRGMQGFIEVVASILEGRPPEPVEQGKGGTHYPPAGLSTFRRAFRHFQAYAVRNPGADRSGAG